MVLIHRYGLAGAAFAWSGRLLAENIVLFAMTRRVVARPLRGTMVNHASIAAAVCCLAAGAVISDLTAENRLSMRRASDARGAGVAIDARYGDRSLLFGRSARRFSILLAPSRGPTVTAVATKVFPMTSFAQPLGPTVLYVAQGRRALPEFVRPILWRFGTLDSSNAPIANAEWCGSIRCPSNQTSGKRIGTITRTTIEAAKEQIGNAALRAASQSIKRAYIAAQLGHVEHKFSYAKSFSATRLPRSDASGRHRFSAQVFAFQTRWPSP